MKYKRIIPLLLVLCCLTACNSRPKNLSDDMYNYAESVIRTADAYMDNQLSYDEAYEKIVKLDEKAEKLYKEEGDNTDNFLAQNYIGLVSSALMLEHSGTYTYADLKESRNNLAKQIGYSERD